jgi:membrane protein
VARAVSVLDLAKSALRRFDEERCFQLAGSLTYTTLLALVPLMTVVLSLGTMFPMFRDWMAHLDVWFEKNVLPEQIAGSVAGYISEFATAAARLTVFGVVLLAATAVMMMMTIDSGLSQIFRVWRPRSLAQQVLIYWAVLTLGPVLMSASISLTSVLVSASFGLTKGMPLLHFIVLRIVPFVLTTTVYTFIYLLVPNRKVHFRHALAGGAVAGIMFEAMQRVFAYIENPRHIQIAHGASCSADFSRLALPGDRAFGAALTAIPPKFFLHVAQRPAAAVP